MVELPEFQLAGIRARHLSDSDRLRAPTRRLLPLIRRHTRAHNWLHRPTMRKTLVAGYLLLRFLQNHAADRWADS